MVTSVVAAFLSVLAGHYSGWFDVQSTKLENQRFTLKQDVARFEKEKLNLHQEYNRVQGELDEVLEKYDQAQQELTLSKNKLVEITEHHLEEVDNMRERIKELTLAKEEAIDRKDNINKDKIEDELDVAEQALHSSEIEAQVAIDRIRKMFDIPQSTLDDWEQKVRQEILQSGDVDDDGCILIDGEQHCTNF